MTNLPENPDPHLTDTRCAWCRTTPDMRQYHDTEWGFPVAADRRLFESLCLESFQAGLSWHTILAKRDHFRQAFADFDYDQIAEFTAADVERLLRDDSIVRHRGKIQAVIHNARCAQTLVTQYGSLGAFFWPFEPDETLLPPPQSVTTLPEAVALSKTLKAMGWQFLGPTTVFAFMQAVGLVNDHAADCPIRANVCKARQAFTKPK